uniref:Uncharacterized protein n=1 Tax=Romanomermis culicivorax TaxID=13658 RepID=A0A915ITY4_ROMCU
MNDYVSAKVNIKSNNLKSWSNELVQHFIQPTEDSILQFIRWPLAYVDAGWNHVLIQPSKTQWNDVVMFWVKNLGNLKFFRVGDSVVVTNLVHNVLQAYVSLEKKNLLIIIEDFYSNAKMRSLILQDYYSGFSIAVSEILNQPVSTYSELLKFVERLENYKAWRFISAMKRSHDQSSPIRSVILPGNQQNTKRRQKTNIKLLEDGGDPAKTKYEIVEHESILH